MMLHQTTARYEALLQAWKPTCTCGWVGDLVDGLPVHAFDSPSKAALAQGIAHQMDAEGAIDWGIPYRWMADR
jgi:hypothetical protein